MRRGVLVSIAISMLFAAVRPAGGLEIADRSWLLRYDGMRKNDVVRDLAISPDGSTLFLAGTVSPGGERSRWVTLAVDAAAGHLRWEAPFAGREQRDEARSIAVSPDGRRVYVTGSTTLSPYAPGGGLMALTTVAYRAATGRRLWVRIHDEPLFVGSSGRDIAVSPDGSRVFVVGGAEDGAFVVAYRSPSGRTRWQVVGAAGGDAFAVVVSPDGKRLFTAGRTQGLRSDYVTAALGTMSGQVRWTRRFDGGARSTDAARDVAVSPDGRTVIVTGGATIEGGGWTSRRADMVTIAYRATDGHRRWIGTPPTWSGDTGGGRVAIDPGGDVAVAVGVRADEGVPPAWITVAHDLRTGDVLWQRERARAVVGSRAPIAAVGGWAAPLDLVVDDEAALVAGGIHSDAGDQDLLVEGYALEGGTRVFRATYAGRADRADLGRAVTLSPGGRVYVAGDSIGRHRWDIVALGYRR